MCLTIATQLTERTKLKSVGVGVRTFWKVVTVVPKEDSLTGRSQLVAPYRGSQYKSGTNVSSRSSSGITEREFRMGAIHDGFHVCITREQARSIKRGGSSRRRIIKVKCWMHDLVAMGCNKDAVFTSMFIPRPEYSRALKSKV